MSPPRDPEALSFPKIVFATVCRKGWPHIEDGKVGDKRLEKDQLAFLAEGLAKALAEALAGLGP
jgi:hypothetical protein